MGPERAGASRHGEENAINLSAREVRGGRYNTRPDTFFYFFMQTTLLHWLEHCGHDYQLAEHPAVHTIAEALACTPTLPGLMCKNIFVRDAKGKRHFLVVVPCDKRIDLLALGQLLQTSRLGLASPERLLQHLGVTPGSVSVLALLHDQAHAVELVLDQAIWDAAQVQAHPLRNTATITMPHATLVAFIAHTGHLPRLVEVPAIC